MTEPVIGAASVHTNRREVSPSSIFKAWRRPTVHGLGGDRNHLRHTENDDYEGGPAEVPSVSTSLQLVQRTESLPANSSNIEEILQESTTKVERSRLNTDRRLVPFTYTRGNFLAYHKVDFRVVSEDELAGDGDNVGRIKSDCAC